MWRKVLFIFLVAGATAEYGWKPNSEYWYEVHTKTLASFHQISDHYTGVEFKARVKIQPKTDTHLTIEITQPQYAEVHTSLPQGVETPIPEGELHYQPLSLSTQPFEVKLHKGVVEELIISREIPVWEVNFIRSIVSQLQVDTQGTKAIDSRLNSIPKHDENTAVYKVMEDTVEGHCEALYDVTPLPKYILQTMPHLAPQPQLAGQGQIIDVMKTKNFTNCIQRPGYHFGLTGLTEWEPTTNKMGNFLSRSSVSRIIISGSLKTYTIQSSVTTNKVILSPELYNSQKGEVVSRVNLTLTSVRSATGSMKGPENPQPLEKLVYDYNSPWTSDAEAREKWDKRTGSGEFRTNRNAIRSGRSIGLMREGKHGKLETESGNTEEWHQKTPTMHEAPESPFLPYFVGYTGHSVQSSEKVNVIEIVKKIASKIGEQVQDQTRIPEKNTLAHFSILTRLIRTMNVEQLEKTTQELYVSDKESTGKGVIDPRRNAWMAYRDAVVQAGTGPALITIANFITSHKIEGEEAAQVVGSLAETARFPTIEYLNTFFELVKHPEVTSQLNLNTSAVFAFTNLVRMSQVHEKTSEHRYPIHAFGYLISKRETAVAEVYIPYFAHQLEEAVKEGHSPKIQTHIRALGNIAHPKIIQVFEPYLNGKRAMTDFQRTLMVVSLNKLAVVHPKLARSVLYKTYVNTGEVYQVRVAAVYNLMKTVPPASMLQRMAQFTNQDPSNQVRSAVKSAIASAAVLNEEANTELRKNAEAAVHLLTNQAFGVQYSQRNLTDYILKGLNLAYMQTLSNIGSEDSLIPQTVFFHLNRDLNGMKHQTLGAGGMISSIKNLGDLLKEKLKYNHDWECTGQVADKSDKGLTIETISNILNMESGSTKQLEGNLLIGISGFKRFFTFDNGTIENLPKLLKEFTQDVENGKTVNYQKFYNKFSVTIGLPTATGLPLVYTLSTPTLLSAKGKFQARATPQQQKSDQVFAMPESVNATTDMFVEYSTRIQSKISFITPFNHKRYIAGYDKNTQFEIPIKKRFDMDLKNGHVRVEVTTPKNKTKNKLFHYSTWPYLGIDDILQFKPVAESENIYRVITGKPQKFQHLLGGKDIGVFFRLEGESDKNYLDLTKFYRRFLKHGLASALLAPMSSETIEQTILDLYYDSEKSTAESIVLTASYDHSLAVEQPTTEQPRGDENEAATTVKNVDSNVRKKEFLEKVKKGIKSSSAAVFDFGLQILGETKSECLTTLAFATGPIDGRTRILSYTRKNVNNKNFEVCFDGVSHIPKVSEVNFDDVLGADLKGDIHGKIHFGEECQTGSKISILGNLKRSQERKEYLESQPLLEEAKRQTKSGYKMQPAQMQVSREAGIFDDYAFTVRYENVPEEVKKMTYQTYSALRFLGYPYLTENFIGHTNLQEGQIELGVNFTPDLKAVDFYIYSPLGDSKFSNVHLNPYLTKCLTVHPMHSTIERMAHVAFNQKYGASCTVDRANFRTFDNTSYSVNLENIWHVMLFSDLRRTYETQTATAGEGSQTTDYVVALVKNTESKQKALKIVLKGLEYTVLDVAPKPEGELLKGSVSVNGQEIPVSTQHVYEYKLDDRTVLLQVYGSPTGEVQIVSPLYKFALLYYGETVRVTVNQDYMNNVKGLCGTNDGETLDFVTPQEYILQNPEEFAATWALSSEGLTGEMKNRAQKHSMYKKSVNLTPVVGEEDLEGVLHHETHFHVGGTEPEDSHGEEIGEMWMRLKKDSSMGCVTGRVHFLENDGKDCFSLHPQPTCTAHCHPETSRTKTGQFYCVEKSATSKHWRQMVTRGANPDFRNKGKTHELEFQYPTKCTTN